MMQGFVRKGEKIITKKYEEDPKKIYEANVEYYDEDRLMEILPLGLDEGWLDVWKRKGYVKLLEEV